MLAALCVTEIVSWGLLYYAFPVLAPRISADTGWSSVAVTSAFSAALVVSALAGVPVGRVIDRHGPRRIMTAGSVLGVVALVVIATAPGLPAFVIGWVIAGAAMAGVLYPPAFAAVTGWFSDRRLGALATLTLVLKGKPARTEEAAEARLNWSDSGEAGSDAAEDSPASGDAAGAAVAEDSEVDAEVASSDAFAVAPPADEATAADSESVSAAPRGTSGAVAAAIANSDSDDSGSEDLATNKSEAGEPEAGDSATNETEASEIEADEVEVADTAENTVDAVADSDIDDVEDSTVVPPQDDAPEVAPAPAEDEEFVDEEESEAPVRRVPASFAARGATSEDADSTGHESQPAKPKL